MKLSEVKRILDAKVLCREEMLEDEVFSVCGSDLMSDVLAFVKDQAVMLTGLVNQQVVRTAEMMDMMCIIFVRGKEPNESIINLARERGLIIMTTEHTMYVACGLLYSNGLGNI
jgi:predicted transcriptional regulator